MLEAPWYSTNPAHPSRLFLLLFIKNSSVLATSQVQPLYYEWLVIATQVVQSQLLSVHAPGEDFHLGRVLLPCRPDF